jgi:hypothetical protein
MNTSLGPISGFLTRIPYLQLFGVYERAFVQGASPKLAASVVTGARGPPWPAWLSSAECDQMKPSPGSERATARMP